MAALSRAAFWTGQVDTQVFCYLDVRAAQPDFILFGSFNREALERRVSYYPEGSFEKVAVELDSPSFHLALRGFKILGGVPQGSPGSKALYWAEGAFGDYGFKIYTLPPNVETSCHRHRQLKETLQLITGLAKIKVGASTKPVLRSRRLRGRQIIPAGFYHQLSAGDVWSLVLVKLEGPDPLGREDYEYNPSLI